MASETNMKVAKVRQYKSLMISKDFVVSNHKKSMMNQQVPIVGFGTDGP